MDEDGLDLSINLNISAPSGKFNKKDRPKVTGNRKERIKQRKEIKKQNVPDTSQEEGERSRADQPDRKRKAQDGHSGPTNKFAKKEGRAFGGPAAGGKKSDGNVISSLFRHNPDIPAVPSKGVTSVKEEVFASTKFSDLPIHPHLAANLEEKMGLATMTRVQQLTIPVVLRDRDVLVKSQTGSGKTLAYAVPVVHTLASLPRKVQRSNGPYVLVIVPTRELAIQSFSTFQKLLQSCVWVVAGCLMGGEKRNKEKARIRKGINILVSTPGRLLDHMQHTDCLHLDRVSCLVIDEADRLLEMGYEKDVSQIVSLLDQRCGGKRQTVLLSATLTAGVERLAGMTLRDQEKIDASEESAAPSGALDSSKGPQPTAGGDEKAGEGPPPSTGIAEGKAEVESFALPDKLRQHFVMVPCKLRLVTLAAFVLWKCKIQRQRSKMVVFLNTQDSVEFHHRLFGLVLNSSPEPKNAGKNMNKDDISLYRLHGHMAQKERTQVFQEFSSASQGLLLCTDVAARGLHLPRVDWIVQYTTPGATVDYIHRVGRTARAGRQGSALLFLMPSEAAYVAELNTLKISLSELAMKDVLTVLLTAIHDLPQPGVESKRQTPRTYEEASTFMQDRFEESVLGDKDLQTLATKGYQSFVRAYATYPAALKYIFSLRDLHLGHVAKSFALRKAPSNLQGKSKVKVRRDLGNPRLKFDNDRKQSFKNKKPFTPSLKVSEYF